MVAPVEGGKYVVIDGQHRTTAAAVAGFERVPCQIVTADRDEQAAAFKALNRSSAAPSRMAFHASAVGASNAGAVRLAEVCARAKVELLRYPVPTDRQSAGQTMAVAAIAGCLERYGQETVIAALQCVTQTSNNRPGVLSARTIKALCAVLSSDRILRDSGLALFATFDGIDLAGLAKAAPAEAAVKKINTVQAMSDLIRLEVVRRSGLKSTGEKSVKRLVESSQERRVALVRASKFPSSENKPATPTKPSQKLDKS